MSQGEALYLIMVIVAVGVFALSLAWTSWRNG
jgi:hypothetical protein